MKKSVIAVCLFAVLALSLIGIVSAAEVSNLQVEGINHTIKLVSVSGTNPSDVTMNVDGILADMNYIQTSFPYTPQKVGALSLILKNIIYQSVVGGKQEADFYIGFDLNLSVEEGKKSKNITIDGNKYVIELKSLDSNSATISVNNEMKSLNPQNSPYNTLANVNGLKIVLKHVVYQEFVGGKQEAEFLIFYEKNLSLTSAATYSNLTDYYNSINYSCNQDSDCVIKNIDPCCTNSYKCLNKDNFNYNLTSLRSLCGENFACAAYVMPVPQGCKCENNICVGYQCAKEGEKVYDMTSKGPTACCAGLTLKLCEGLCTPSILGTCENETTGCKNLYWIDNENKSCGKKQFCGAYMYLGLQTFESKTQCEKVVNETKNKTERPKNATFIPWQKRNESECPQGCECHGAVVSCQTADGKIMTIEAGRSGNIITITVGGKEADTKLTIESEADNNNKTKIKAGLSNGRKAEIKIMPDTASERAIGRLGDLGFTIELKEVGKGNETTVVYELTGKKQGKFLGIFKIMASEKVQVDAETGEVKKVIKPWWSFLATGI